MNCTVLWSTVVGDQQPSAHPANSHDSNSSDSHRAMQQQQQQHITPVPTITGAEEKQK